MLDLKAVPYGRVLEWNLLKIVKWIEEFIDAKEEKNPPRT
jgi:hypothetical protein